MRNEKTTHGERCAEGRADLDMRKSTSEKQSKHTSTSPKCCVWQPRRAETRKALRAAAESGLDAAEFTQGPSWQPSVTTTILYHLAGKALTF